MQPSFESSASGSWHGFDAPRESMAARVGAARLLQIGALAALAYALALLIAGAASADLGFLVYQGGPVARVAASSAAAAAGLREGDEIVAVDGLVAERDRDADRAVRAVEPGDSLHLTVRRGDVLREVRFAVGRQLPIGAAAGVALAALLLALAGRADGRGRRPRLQDVAAPVVYVVLLAGAFSIDVAVRSSLFFGPWIAALALAGPLTCELLRATPGARRWLSRPERALLYGPPLALAAAMVVNHALFELDRPLAVHRALPGWVGSAALALGAGYLGVGAAGRARRLWAGRRDLGGWRRGGGAALATLLAAATYLAMIGVAGLTSSMDLQGFAAAVGITGAAALLFGPVRDRLELLVGPRHEPDRRRARRLLRDAAESAIATLELDALEREVVDRVRSAFGAAGAAIYISDGDRWRRRVAAGAVDLDDVVAGRLAHRLDAAVAAREIREIDGATVAVPLPVDDRAPAALLVTPRAGRALDDEDRDLLATSSASLVVAMRNARSLRALGELSARLRDELELGDQRRREIARLRERLDDDTRAAIGLLGDDRGRPPIIGKGLAATFELVHKAARSDATVLVRGETGVGKELVARAIHAASPRRSGPFVVVDCAALAPGLFESALFGHERGAFTGAVKAATGAFRAAHGGTIFLDEVGELPLDLQPKLLRVLQEREVLPVGGDQPIAVDVRVVGGTNRDLAAEVAAGGFREDLLYRLQVVELTVPPLRVRRPDIQALAEHFLARLADRDGRPPRRLAADAIDALLEYDWPGNVRELQHAIEAAAVYAEGDDIRAADLPILDRLRRRRVDRAMSALPVADGGPPRAALRQTLEDLERDRLVAALTEHGGNRTRAARALGMSRGALLRRLKRYRLDEAAAAD